MCTGKELTAKIVGELGDEVMLLVYLYDKSDNSGESINAHMVAKGHAWLSTLNETVENADPVAFEHNQEELGKQLTCYLVNVLQIAPVIDVTCFVDRYANQQGVSKFMPKN